MKWIPVILMGILMSGCARGPVVTHRQLAPNQYEITAKSGNLDSACLEFYQYSHNLCEEKGREGLFYIKDSKATVLSGTFVGIIECPRDGHWIKGNTPKSEWQKDFYECKMDSEMINRKINPFEGGCEFIYRLQGMRRHLESCLRAKGYEFVKKGEEEDLKPPVHQPPLAVNWDFLVESKSGDSKLYLDWDSVKWGYSGDDVTFRFGDDVTFRLKDENTNGNYTILTSKYYCTKKKFAVMHGSTYNREGQLIEDRSKWDDIPKDITSNVMDDLYDILCGPILKRKKEK